MLNNADIKRLIKGCKAQKWTAQKELYLHYADDMMGIAIRYSKDIDSAKDLVQETFFTFFKKIDQFDPKKGTVGGWMSRILINQSLKDARKNGRITFPDEVGFAKESSNDISIIDQLQAEDILNLLKQLPEGCRIIFNLKVIEGYAHNEIGDILGITPSASRSQLTRAKKLLRAIIEKQSTSENYSRQNRRVKQA